MHPPAASPDRTVRRTFKYRLYPTAAQVAALEEQLRFCCDLYNAALEQRRDAWKRGRRRVTLYDQQRDLTELRAALPYPEKMSAWVQRDPLARLDRAFQAFFRRCNAGKAPGYPRFRPLARYDSLTWSGTSGTQIRDGVLALAGIGAIRVRWRREIPDYAKIKTTTVKRKAGRWYVCFSLELPLPLPLPYSDDAVGVDVGITTFVALSTGELISGPRAYRKSRRDLRIAQRRVARRRNGSHRRLKAVRILQRKHESIRNVRLDHGHKVALGLTRRYGYIFVEDLQVSNLVRSAKATIGRPGRNVRQKAGLNREIQDQAWAQFVGLLREKAEWAAREVIAVLPLFTSQTCSECGLVDDASRRGTRFVCTSCGYSDNSDVNAAKNILGLGQSLQALTQDEEVRVA